MRKSSISKVVLSAVCAGVIGSSALYATPSTQIWIPSTDIQGFLKPHIGWDVYSLNDGTGMISNGGLTMGVLPFEKLGLEVGVDYRAILGGDQRKPIYTNAKIGTPEDGLFKYMPAVAVGIYDLGFVKDVNDYSLVYGLLAKNIWKLGRISAGYYYGAGSESLWMVPGDTTGKVERGGLLASWDRVITEISDKLWVAVDYQSGNNWYGALSFGVAWNFAPNVGVILGYDIYNNKDASVPTFTFQVDINAF